jgi:hypothetical protein
MAFQHATPLIIDDLESPQKIVRLDRIRRSLKSGGGPRFVETLVQQLVHNHPSSLPVEEIEPVFKHLRSICQELKLRIDGTDRYVDNLLVNPDGRICLVECKLWHNPESVREVVGQMNS